MSGGGGQRRKRADRRKSPLLDGDRPPSKTVGPTVRASSVHTSGKRPARTRLRRLWSGHPVLRAVIIFVVLIGLFYGFIHTPYVGDEPFHPYLRFIARVTGGILGVLGYDITVADRAISSPDFSMAVVRGCDAIEPVAAFTAAVLASPVSFWLKIPGVVLGSLALLVINLARLVSLFLVGIYFPRAFDLIHMDVWQALFIVLAICFWAIWVQWATRSGSDGLDHV